MPARRIGTGDLLPGSLLHRRQARPIREFRAVPGQVLGRLVGQQGADFLGQFAEVLGADIGTAHQASLSRMRGGGSHVRAWATVSNGGGQNCASVMHSRTVWTIILIRTRPPGVCRWRPDEYLADFFQPSREKHHDPSIASAKSWREADYLFNNDEVEAAIGRVAGRSTTISARPTRWSSA